jgi:hypothetical protein
MENESETEGPQANPPCVATSRNFRGTRFDFPTSDWAVPLFSSHRAEIGGYRDSGVGVLGIACEVGLGMLAIAAGVNVVPPIDPGPSGVLISGLPPASTALAGAGRACWADPGMPDLIGFR